MENITDGAVVKGKGRKKNRKPRERIIYHVDAGHINDHAAPAHALSEGFTAEMHRDQAKPDETKNMSHAVPTVTSDIGQRYQADHNRYQSGGAAEMATPAERAAGGNAQSVEDFNQSRSGTSSRVAVGHGDLRQSNTDFSTVLARLSTRRGNVVDLGVPDNTPGGFSHPGEVALRLFDGRTQAGGFDGMAPVGGNPLRPADHQSRGSATAPNGTHSSSSQQGACYPPRESMKASDRVSVMKAALFPHD